VYRLKDDENVTHIYSASTLTPGIKPLSFVTSAKEVMFLPALVGWFVCLFVSLSVSNITQKVINGF